MDPTTATLIAGLGGTALGGLIAAGAGWLQANRQRKWQLEDVIRQQAIARDAEVRARADKAALEARAELDVLERTLIPPLKLAHFVWPERQEDKDVARDSVDRLARAAAVMQEPLRHHVELAARILPDADQLATTWLQVHPRTVAWGVIHNARQAITRFLRNEEVEAGLPSPVAEYSEAWSNFRDDVEQQIAHHMKALQSPDGGSGAEPAQP